MSSSAKMSGRNASASDAVEDFRTVVRVAAAEAGQPVNEFLRKLFDHTLVKDADGNEFLSRSSFENGLTSLKAIRGKLTRSALNTVFLECDESGRGKVTLQERVRVFRHSVSHARKKKSLWGRSNQPC